MFMGNGQHSGAYSSPSVQSTPQVNWKVKTGGQVISSPVVTDNMLYVGSTDNYLYAIHTSNGKIAWKYETAGPVNSSPLVADGKVMFLSYDGFFYALNQHNGKLVWKFKTGGETKFKVKDYFNGSFKPDFWDFYLSSPVANNNFVYFGSSDSHIYALDIESGKEIWKYQTGGSIHSSPAVSDNSLVVGSWDSKVYCLDATSGRKKWSYATDMDLESYIWLGVQASPSIKEGVVYIGSRDAKLYALNLDDGDPVWVNNNFERSWMPSSAAIDENNIYTGSSDSFSFYSIDKKTGSINYSTPTNAYTFSSPAIDQEMAYIGSANGRLYGIELETGNIKWEFQTFGAKTDSIQIFDHEGKMDIDRYKDLVKDIEDMPTLSTFMNSAFVSSGAVLSSPVIVDQVLYFGSCDGNVYAISDN